MRDMLAETETPQLAQTPNTGFMAATKLHELLGYALADFEYILTDQRYSIDHGAWHQSPDDDARCCVCMAGAVMARTYRVAHGDATIPDDLGIDAARRLYAIDLLRQGYISEALVEFTGADVAQSWQQWGLQQKWEHRLRDYEDEQQRYQARGLLRDLRGLQADLQKANI